MLTSRRMPLCVPLLAVWLTLRPAPASAKDTRETEQLRPLSPDRPDVTESPHTVDAGHFQTEMDFFTSERDEGETTLSFAVTNLKLGVAPFLDLQLVVRPLVATPAVTADGIETLGYRDPVARVKVALYGNDGGRFALGALGFVRIPVPGSAGFPDPGTSDRAWEGGLALPMAVELPLALALGAMVEVDVQRNAALDGHHPGLLASIALSRPLVGPLSAMVEGVVRASLDEDFAIPATVNGALLYRVNEDLLLDAGAYVGVTEDAPDVLSFAGITFRI